MWTDARRSIAIFVWGVFVTIGSVSVAEEPRYERDVAPLLKRHCVKCHGPSKQEGALNLAFATSLQKGGESGPVVIAHDVDGSLLWQRVAADEMPPDHPLNAAEKAVLKQWIIAGTPGLNAHHSQDESTHWSFQPLRRMAAPKLDPHVRADCESAIDCWVTAGLRPIGLRLSDEADRWALIRRVSIDLTGLPPQREAIEAFLADANPDAYERMVDRYLASPHLGERLGKVWLDAAGYADSNGYFNADSDRPLAYRYRDYVIRAMNADRPFDQFVREQIAGDELAGVPTKLGATIEFGERDPDRVIELLEATHYLRCGQDGTGESDGNPDEVRVDRYTVIETAMQNLSTGLLGMTIQCAKCHDHKFEPLTQRDYYSLQAVLIPAFPPARWVKPNDRIVFAPTPSQSQEWQEGRAKAEADVQRLGTELAEWVQQHRPRGRILFADDFESSPGTLAERWSATAPGDDIPGGTSPVNVNSAEAPGAIIRAGRLELIEGGEPGDKWLSTQQAFDWTPDIVGAAIQVTFDLVDHHVANSPPAERIGYFIGLRDFNDNSGKSGGNLLIDGNPQGSTAIFVDYPGQDARQKGAIGETGYTPGHNYGVRITNSGGGKFQLQQLVDWQAEEKSATLTTAELADGGFGFEFCCGRSFIVDNVIVEAFAASAEPDSLGAFVNEVKERRKGLDEARKRHDHYAGTQPGKIAWTTDVTTPPAVHLFLRGNYDSPGEEVRPRGFAFLDAVDPRIVSASMPANLTETASRPVYGSGRRLAFAEWLTAADSPQSGLLARTQVNRFWQMHFGTGIAATPENLGLSGSPPTHPELLESLASDFVQRGWSVKQLLRQIVTSRTYRQQSNADGERLRADPDGRRLSRFPVRRLDAEAIRDLFLAVSGELDERLYGPYVATSRTGTGETVVAESSPDARRRSIYLQQKRTQVHSLLQVFDAPSIVFNSTRRARSTMPIQSLALLNSEFSTTRARHMAESLLNQESSLTDRVTTAFTIAIGRPPDDNEFLAATKFLNVQRSEHLTESDADAKAWADLCQSLLMSNAALYLE